MDHRKKTHLNTVLDINGTSPWIRDDGVSLPERMRQDLLVELTDLPVNSTKKTGLLVMLARTVAAACLLALISYSWEQAYSLKKLNALENRLAQDTVIHYSGLDQLNRVLVLNSFIDLDKLRELGAEKARQQYAEVLPAWFNSNLFGDQVFKFRLEKQIHALKINPKIK